LQVWLVQRPERRHVPRAANSDRLQLMLGPILDPVRGAAERDHFTVGMADVKEAAFHNAPFCENGSAGAEGYPKQPETGSKPDAALDPHVG
jgi:hypothetical protein